MSQCQACGKLSNATVLVKVQWFGRGTKWLCLDCVRTAALSAEKTTSSPDHAGERKPTYERKA